MDVIVDTNTLIYAAKDKIDLFKLIKEHFPDSEAIIPEEVIKELKTIKDKARKLNERKAASLALKIMNSKHIKKIKMGEGEVDSLLIEEALNRNAPVITSDKNLKGKLKKAGVKTVYLKQKRILEDG